MADMTARMAAEAVAKRAKAVSYEVASKSTAEKNNALKEIAKELTAQADYIIGQNRKDVDFAKEIGKTPAIIERLVLDKKRIDAMAEGLLSIAALPDPVGSGSSIQKRPNGLKILKVRVPIGVVAMIYESRPNVTSDAAGLTLKSGNTVILRGGKEALHSNIAIADIVRTGLEKAGFPKDAVQLIDRTEHEVVDELLLLNQYIDVVIPRGGESLIKSVVEKSRIPVIKHDKGVCHVFVDESADPEKAEAIVINAKCQRPSVCNAIETLLLHENYPHKEAMIKKLLENQVEVIADKAMHELFSDLKPATEADWFTEYLDYKISVRVVKDVKEAVEHINFYGSHHSDAILSENYDNTQFFLDRVDSAVVYANASTRFTDGAEFGLGAEIGISTQKLHARGPMGLESLTSEKWVVYGSGQVRG